MNILKQNGEHITAELFDSLDDRVRTIKNEVRIATMKDKKLDKTCLMFDLAERYAPECDNDIEDLYFLHHVEADEAYNELKFGFGDEPDYMRRACVALLYKKISAII